jgi:hypothetical protein
MHIKSEQTRRFAAANREGILDARAESHTHDGAFRNRIHGTFSHDHH